MNYRLRANLKPTKIIFVSLVCPAGLPLSLHQSLPAHKEKVTSRYLSLLTQPIPRRVRVGFVKGKWQQKF